MNMFEVCTVASCPINCEGFCPQETLRKSYHGERRLSVENFKLALSHVPKYMAIVFCGFVEPFLNSDALKMMEIAKSEGYAVWLNSTLVGLRYYDVDRLAAVDPAVFVLHLPDPCGKAKIVLSAEYKETLMQVLTKTHVTGFSTMNKHMQNNTRAGNVSSTNLHFRGPFTCERLPYDVVMMPDGTVSGCGAMDFGLKHVLGNIFKSTFEELIAGDEYQKMLKNRHQMDGDTLCRSCLWAVHGKRYYLTRMNRLAFKTLTKLGVYPKEGLKSFEPQFRG